jgi:hypothetical protein
MLSLSVEMSVLNHADSEEEEECDEEEECEDEVDEE